jgi:hypothetical protein
MIFQRDQPDDRMPHVFRALAARANGIVTPRRLELRAEPAKPICQCFRLSPSPAPCSIRSGRRQSRLSTCDGFEPTGAGGRSRMSNLIVNAITRPRRRKTGREQEAILLPVCGLNARPQMFQTQTRQLRENEIISSMSTSEVSFIWCSRSVVYFLLSKSMPRPAQAVL